jgi:hypothetical protein
LAKTQYHERLGAEYHIDYAEDDQVHGAVGQAHSPDRS